MNINSIPVVGWIISFIVNASLAVPFYITWSACGIGRRYFYFVPEVYQSVPFWDCVGIFMTVGMLRCLAFGNSLRGLGDAIEKTKRKKEGDGK